jgi:hypothetical protein
MSKAWKAIPNPVAPFDAVAEFNVTKTIRGDEFPSGAHQLQTLIGSLKSSLAGSSNSVTIPSDVMKQCSSTFQGHCPNEITPESLDKLYQNILQDLNGMTISREDAADTASRQKQALSLFHRAGLSDPALEARASVLVPFAFLGEWQQRAKARGLENDPAVEEAIRIYSPVVDRQKKYQAAADSFYDHVKKDLAASFALVKIRSLLAQRSIHPNSCSSFTLAGVSMANLSVNATASAHETSADPFAVYTPPVERADAMRVTTSAAAQIEAPIIDTTQIRDVSLEKELFSSSPAVPPPPQVNPNQERAEIFLDALSLDSPPALIQPKKKRPKDVASAVRMGFHAIKSKLSRHHQPRDKGKAQLEKIVLPEIAAPIPTGLKKDRHHKSKVERLKDLAARTANCSSILAKGVFQRTKDALSSFFRGKKKKEHEPSLSCFHDVPDYVSEANQTVQSQAPPAGTEVSQVALQYAKPDDGELRESSASNSNSNGSSRHKHASQATQAL